MKRPYLSALVISTLALGGCGGSSDGGGTTGNTGSGSGGNTNPLSYLNSPWTLMYDNGSGMKDVVIGVIYNGFFYGGNEHRFAYGRVLTGERHIQIDMHNPEGNFGIAANKMSNHLYIGMFDPSGGSVNLARYSSTGRTQVSMHDTWQTINKTSFDIDANGNFSVVHDETGCQLDARVEMLEAGIYQIKGKASACIDGKYQGSFRGMGTIPVNINVLGKWQKVFSPVLIFAEGTTDVGYFPFSIKNY